MSTKRAAIYSHRRSRQRGAALMVMLVIIIIGAVTFFVASLNSSALQISRDKVTANALAKAKEALIGRAIADLTSPGSLPCPDNNDDGSADLFSGHKCPYYVGRLPWKTLGLPDLRDGAGERLWYALSPNFRDYVSVVPINSDTQGTLTISGTSAASNVIAIVFASDSALSNQSRSSSNTAACTTTGTPIFESLCATNYLEGSNANLNTSASINLGYQTAASSSTFNDQMIYITHDQLFSSVEIRIAREAKKCLDDYASSYANKYPWAAPVTDSTYTGTYSTYFGRIPATPNIDTSSGSLTTDATMSNSWSAVSSCTTLLGSSYWANWEPLVFYQVADGYRPGGSVSCGSCLSISGSGNTSAGSGMYRAAVLVARQALATQTRSFISNATYLEGINPHATTPSTSFETYSSSDVTNYSTVNDLVLCLDGKVNCL
jgi:hypothetical protein